jgi:hypothetical protein
MSFLQPLYSDVRQRDRRVPFTFIAKLWIVSAAMREARKDAQLVAVCERLSCFGDIAGWPLSSSRRQSLKQLRFADGLYQVCIEARLSRALPILLLSPSG